MLIPTDEKPENLSPLLDPGGDYMVRSTVLDGAVRVIAVRTTDICAQAQVIHGLSPVATAAFGRLLTGVLMLTPDLEKKNDTITAIIRSDGPIEGMTVIGESGGRVRGTVCQPVVPTTYIKPGKLNVGCAVGAGQLTVVRDLGMKEPYIGQVELVSGEIAEDLTAYLAISEQIPTVMSLGVRMELSGVTHAGGFLVQLLPGAGDDIVTYLEQRVAGFLEVSFLLAEGFNPHQIIDLLIGDPNIIYHDVTRCSYSCPCSRERMERNLLTLGREELNQLAEDPAGINLECHFCDRTYPFTQTDVRSLITD